MKEKVSFLKTNIAAHGQREKERESLVTETERKVKRFYGSKNNKQTINYTILPLKICGMWQFREEHNQ